MTAWRKRLSFITERFETSHKSDEKPKELPASASADEAAASSTTPESEASSLQTDQEESDAAEVFPATENLQSKWLTKFEYFSKSYQDVAMVFNRF